MSIETQERVKTLKSLLNDKVKQMIDYINEQYEDASPVFLKEGETGEVDQVQANAKSLHLALLRNTENRILQLFLMVDETMKQVHFTNEKQWLENVEKEAQMLLNELEGLK